MHVHMGVSQRKVWKKAISKSTLQIKVYEGFFKLQGSHFLRWIDYNGVAHFRISWGKTVLLIYG